MDVLPIGSIFEEEDLRFIVLGYTLIANYDRYVYCYLVAVYPMGFTTIDDLGVIPVNDVKNIVFVGYKNNNCLDYLENKKTIVAGTNKISVSEGEKLFEMLNSELKKMEV